MKALLATTTAALTFTALSATAAPIQVTIPGSDANDFGISCQEGTTVNLLVDKSKDNSYRYARSISLTEMGGGRVVISYLKGRGVANEQATYLSTANEHCEIYRQ